MSIHDVRLDTMEPAELARLVNRASDGGLRQVLRGERRTEILDHLVGGMPAGFRPRVDRAVPQLLRGPDREWRGPDQDV